MEIQCLTRSQTVPKHKLDINVVDVEENRKDKSEKKSGGNHTGQAISQAVSTMSTAATEKGTHFSYRALQFMSSVISRFSICFV